MSSSICDNLLNKKIASNLVCAISKHSQKKFESHSLQFESFSLFMMVKLVANILSSLLIIPIQIAVSIEFALESNPSSYHLNINPNSLVYSRSHQDLELASYRSEYTNNDSPTQIGATQSAIGIQIDTLDRKFTFSVPEFTYTS